LSHWHAIVQILDGFSNDWACINVVTKAFTCCLNNGAQGSHIQPLLYAVVGHLQTSFASLSSCLSFLRNTLLCCTLLITLFAIQNVCTGNVVLTAAH
jgi:hypothetical protein